jgi:hypothetical protein
MATALEKTNEASQEVVRSVPQSPGTYQNSHNENRALMSQLAPYPKAPETLIQELRQLITDARRHAASVVNSTLTLLYWRVGDRIRRDVLQNGAPGTENRFLPRCRKN